MKQRVKEKVYTGNKASKKYKIFKNIAKKMLHLFFRKAKISIKLVHRFQTALIHLNKLMKWFSISWKYAINYLLNIIILI